MLVPDGHDWVEYMVTETADTATTRRAASLLPGHARHSEYLQDGDRTWLYAAATPNIGRDGRWLLQLYDKNNTRTEVMVRKPVEKPCCSR